MFRAGLYARVSTNDQQTLPMQNRAMREYAARRGWTIAMQVREVGSGAVQREAREKLMEAARRREIDVVLVWRLDRWGRSVTDLLATLQELAHLGVGFVSLTEALDLTTPAGRAMAGLLAIFAEFEREILRLRKGEIVDVRRLAPEDACASDMLVLIPWHGRNMAVPLSQLAAIDPDESTEEAIGDWHYWVGQGYSF
ncbi:MAG: recombinase family protein [Acidobacteriota bacterium]|nr:recombinase family protein [Acidobacteriota bacterium]